MTTPNYTDEVRAVLAAYNPPEPSDPPPPPGKVRYFIAVEDDHHEGVADPATVAALLRQVADFLHPTPGADRPDRSTP